VRDAPAAERPVVARVDSQPGSQADSRVEYVQREVEVQPPPFVPVESVQTAADETPPAPAQAPQAAQAAQGQEPEELLKKLYDPLVRRLKAELWLDRERRGALTDRWR
jgi:pyruvate/2-oxoglutarate dehydrogenase complex dihydrolipoamide acyltransferase (E2) component